MSLQAIKYTRGSLELLDQRLLPFEVVYLPVPNAQASWQQIKDMVVRGAPAIGVTGALTMAVELVANKNSGAAFASVAEAVDFINSTLDYLVTRWVRAECATATHVHGPMPGPCIMHTPASSSSRVPAWSSWLLHVRSSSGHDLNMNSGSLDLQH